MNMQELWLLCMTSRLFVLYKCMKFRCNTSNGYQVIELARNSRVNDQREMTLKIRVMVFVHGTPSESALYMYEVSSIYLLQFSSYRADTILWRTDRQTQGTNNISPNLPGGDIITAFNLHNYEMLYKMTNSTYGYNVLNKHYHITSLWYL